jgi:hypothetical protein
MTNAEDKDLAMAISTSTKGWSTSAIVFGCLETDIADFTARLDSAGAAIKHPMLLPGLFAELQRKRHTDLVASSVTSLLQNILRLGKPVPDRNHTSINPNDLLKQWIDITYLSSGLETWKYQLVKMVQHIDELSSTNLYSQSGFTEEGLRIQERLADIIVEYDELRRKCSLVVDGTSLANGMVSMYLVVRQHYNVDSTDEI